MWVLAFILILIFILFIVLVWKLIKWLRKPTYWHKTDSGWYGTGHDELTDKDIKHIRKQNKRK